MDITPEQLARALYQRESITAATLKALANAPKGFDVETADEAVVKLAAGSALDGILGAMAWVAVTSDQYATPRQRRELADQVRTGLIKFMNVADRDRAEGRDWEVGPEGRPH